MAALTWDATGEHLYETGVDHGVLYVYNNNAYGTGVAWNGLTAVNESPTGGEISALYADNIKYLNLISAEEFEFSIEAYSSPEEFDECDGMAQLAAGVTIGQQSRKTFGFVYRTRIGNDTEGDDHGYKLHIVYGALASPSDRGYSTVNDSPEAITLTWECSTTPVEVTGYKNTAHIEIDSTLADATALAALEAKLFGDEENEPTLLMPDEVAAIFAESDAA